MTRLALQIGVKAGLSVATDTLLKIRETEALKNLESADSRREELMDAFEVRGRSLRNKYVLLFDDIYRSGETLRAATETLYKQGKVERVYVLTLTRTRTKR